MFSIERAGLTFVDGEKFLRITAATVFIPYLLVLLAVYGDGFSLIDTWVGDFINSTIPLLKHVDRHRNNTWEIERIISITWFCIVFIQLPMLFFWSCRLKKFYLSNIRTENKVIISQPILSNMLRQQKLVAIIFLAVAAMSLYVGLYEADDLLKGKHIRYISMSMGTFLFLCIGVLAIIRYKIVKYQIKIRKEDEKKTI